jgi:hypothetical protein
MKFWLTFEACFSQRQKNWNAPILAFYSIIYFLRDTINLQISSLSYFSSSAEKLNLYYVLKNISRSDLWLLIKKIIEVNVIELSELLKWSWGITNEKNNVFNHFQSYSNFYYIDSIIKIFKSNPIILILFEIKNDFIFVIYIIISKSMFVCLWCLRPVSLEPVRPKVESRGKNFPEKWSVAKLLKMCATYIYCRSLNGYFVQLYK